MKLTSGQCLDLSAPNITFPDVPHRRWILGEYARPIFAIFAVSMFLISTLPGVVLPKALPATKKAAGVEIIITAITQDTSWEGSEEVKNWPQQQFNEERAIEHSKEGQVFIIVTFKVVSEKGARIPVVKGKLTGNRNMSATGGFLPKPWKRLDEGPGGIPKNWKLAKGPAIENTNGIVSLTSTWASIVPSPEGRVDRTFKIAFLVRDDFVIQTISLASMDFNFAKQ